MTQGAEVMERHRELLEACEAFIRDRGRHDGPHVTAPWQPCLECELAYVRAEAAFDVVVAALRAGRPAPGEQEE